ncbi:hypothetical protein GOP47_0021547 [Adiantum capillus-veneris]|uniref:Uncharacterized protein n=1 Tax=Adiantum capillus-veneris TaxID=13818 RepID=A0A9D4U8D2_ADICA|nr:hypothetical protein GOP47_0021547 [Adiantum capillus-veneris]
MATLERAHSSMEQNALLKDLYEKKQNIRRIANEVGSMASELRDVRARMAIQEVNLEQETARRQAAEAKAIAMEKELEVLQKSLEERNGQTTSTAAVAEQYLRELVDGRARLGSIRETVETNALSAATAQSQYKVLMKELEIKDEALIEQDAYARKLSQQLLDLQQELHKREGSQKHLKDEVEKMEVEMKLAVAKMINRKDSDLQSSLQDLTMKNAEQLVKHLSVKDEEIVRQREELRLLSAQLKMKARELEVQVDNHRSADQDLKKRVLKLEFWLQQARNQSRKLQRIAERKEKELKDIRARLASQPSVTKHKSSFWGSPKLKIIMSVSAVALFIFAKR